MRRSIAFIGCLVSLAALEGCAPKVSLSPEFKGNVPRSVALLTVDTKGVNRAETVDYLASALRSELSSQGFLVLDQRVVDAVCKHPGCDATERQELQHRGAQAFVQLVVDTQSENNFGLGYYNTVAGKLMVTDVALRELATVTHQQSERGGLLFSSGQVLQGLQDSVGDLQGQNRNYLSDEFIRTLVGQLPRPSSDITTNESMPQISRIDVKATRPPVTEVCASGQPGLNASLLIDRGRTPLREVSPGTYCGNFVFAGGLSGPARAQVELRTQFGSAARREVPLPSIASCDLQSRIKVVSLNGTRRIEVTCAQQVAEACSNPLGECGITRLIVYRAAQPGGPFVALGNTDKASWTDTKNKSGDGFYQVVAVNGNGTRSLPIAPAADQ